MKLRDLPIGQKFIPVNGSGKRYEKLSDNGGIATYNVCLCITDVEKASKGDRMMKKSLIMSTNYNIGVDKDIEIFIID